MGDNPSTRKLTSHDVTAHRHAPTARLHAPCRKGRHWKGLQPCLLHVLLRLCELLLQLSMLLLLCMFLHMVLGEVGRRLHGICWKALPRGTQEKRVGKGAHEQAGCSSGQLACVLV